MDSLLYAALLSAVVAFLCAPKLIPILRKMKFGQSIREEGPESHYVKAGTPTMGGLIISLGLTISTLFFAKFSIEIILALFITLGHALLGFIDDFINDRNVIGIYNNAESNEIIIIVRCNSQLQYDNLIQRIKTSLHVKYTVSECQVDVEKFLKLLPENSVILMYQNY